MTMMTFPTKDPRSCGVVETDVTGIVHAFHEKVRNPPTSIANAAVYIFEPKIFDVLRSLSAEKIDLSTEVMPLLMGSIYTFLNTTYHRDIGTIESWRAAQRDYACKYHHPSSAESWNKLIAEYPEIPKAIASLL